MKIGCEFDTHKSISFTDFDHEFHRKFRESRYAGEHGTSDVSPKESTRYVTVLKSKRRRDADDASV